MSNERITSASQIPTAKYYVTMTDTFFSGWGRAEQMTNKLCFVCDTYAQALIVKENAIARGDQKYVNIRSTKPNVTNKSQYWQVKTQEDYDSWYKKGYFSN